MSLTFPDTGHEFLVMIVPVLTLLLALCFVLVPGKVLKFMGLETKPAHPEAIAEGRSSFAGSMLAVSLGCLLLQDPIALQPGLNFMLASGWSIAAFGRVLQLIFDNGNRKRVQVRFILAAGMALAAWSVTEIPNFHCSNPWAETCQLPINMRGWVLFWVALLTFGFGLIALFAPDRALFIMRLQTRIKTPFARGETRGTLAGFFISIGGANLLMPQPVDFVALVMGAAWVFTGGGRVLSILFDRGWTLYNILTAVFALVSGLAVTGIILGML